MCEYFREGEVHEGVNNMLAEQLMWQVWERCQGQGQGTLSPLFLCGSPRGQNFPPQSFPGPLSLPTPPKQNLHPGASAQTSLLMSKESVWRAACVKMSQQVVQAEVSRQPYAMLLTESITLAPGKGCLAF